MLIDSNNLNGILPRGDPGVGKREDGSAGEHRRGRLGRVIPVDDIVKGILIRVRRDKGEGSG